MITNSKPNYRIIFGMAFLLVTMIWLVSVLFLYTPPPPTDLEVARNTCESRGGLRHFYPAMPTRDASVAIGYGRWRAICGDNTLVIGPWEY